MPPSYSRYLKNKGIDGLTSLHQDPVATLSSMRNDPHTLATQSLMEIGKTPVAEANSLLELSRSRLDNYGSLMFILQFVLDQGQIGNQTSTIICIYYHVW